MRMEICPAGGLEPPAYRGLTCSHATQSSGFSVPAFPFQSLSHQRAQHQLLSEAGGPFTSPQLVPQMRPLIRVHGCPVLHGHRTEQETWVGGTLVLSRDGYEETEYTRCSKRQEGRSTPIRSRNSYGQTEIY